ncbi:MAG: two component transcriptional regulator, winged helix family [Solirubrobacterales bacterium]|nr:two component transcriptional regulator, winged helix family [Solirubrobacterales bacterium]
MRVGALVVDPVSREVRLDDVPIEVSQKEFALLRVLVSDVTRVFTKEELVQAVWGTKSLGSSRTLDSHACRLRQKLSGSEHQYILNVWGVGYRLLDGAAGATR